MNRFFVATRKVFCLSKVTKIPLMCCCFETKSYFTSVNYLAHIYLSGEDEIVTIGNFMADAIKGKSYEKYQRGIQKGIILHRNIDTFTDQHSTVRQSTRRLHKKYGHYSGIIVDILYDHFLAKNWKHYHNLPLSVFVDGFYTSLKRNENLLTPAMRDMVPIMINENWLLSYAEISGIATVLHNMNRRTKYRSGMNTATEELSQYYQEFELEFQSFFEELRAYSAKRLRELNATI